MKANAAGGLTRYGTLRNKTIMWGQGEYVRGVTPLYFSVKSTPFINKRASAEIMESHMGGFIRHFRSPRIKKGGRKRESRNKMEIQYADNRWRPI